MRVFSHKMAILVIYWGTSTTHPSLRLGLQTLHYSKKTFLSSGVNNLYLGRQIFSLQFLRNRIILASFLLTYGQKELSFVQLLLPSSNNHIGFSQVIQIENSGERGISSLTLCMASYITKVIC